MLFFLQLYCLRKIKHLFVTVISNKRKKNIWSNNQMFYVNVNISSLLTKADNLLMLTSGECLKWVQSLLPLSIHSCLLFEKVENWSFCIKLIQFKFQAQFKQHKLFAFCGEIVESDSQKCTATFKKNNNKKSENVLLWWRAPKRWESQHQSAENSWNQSWRYFKCRASKFNIVQ